MRSKALVIILAVAMVMGMSLSGLFSGTAVADDWGTGAIGTKGIGPSGEGDYKALQDTASSSAVIVSDMYIGTKNVGQGLEIWKNTAGVYTQVVGQTEDDLNPLTPPAPTEPGFGDPNNEVAITMGESGHVLPLYVGTVNQVTGCEVWKYDGSDWDQVNTNGFGSISNTEAVSMVFYDPPGLAPQALYVGTSNKTTGGQIWRYDGGTSWAKVNTDGFGDAYNTKIESLCVYDSKLHAGTYNQGEQVLPGTFPEPPELDPDAGCEVWASTNGTSWTEVVGQGPTDTSDLRSVSVAPNSSTAWAIGPEGKISKTTDWVNWDQCADVAFDLNGISAVNTDVVYAVGDGGVILKSTDGGTTWIQKTSNTTNRLNSVYALDISTIMAVGDNGTIVRSSNQGANWTVDASGTTANLRGITIGSVGLFVFRAWAVGDGGTVVRSEWFLVWGPWVPEASGTTTEHLYGVACVAGYQVWAVGNNGTIIRSRSGGAWATEDSGTEEPLRGAAAFDAFLSYSDIVYAVGDHGTIRRSLDGGDTTWVPQPSRTTNDLKSISSVVFGGDNMVAAVGTGGTVRMTDDTGSIDHYRGLPTERGFGDNFNAGATSMATYTDPNRAGERLYVGTTFIQGFTEQGFIPKIVDNGCQAWEYDPDAVAPDYKLRPIARHGFRTKNANFDSGNKSVSSLKEFNKGDGNALYCGTNNRNSGCEIWQYTGYNGTSDLWREIVGRDFFTGVLPADQEPAAPDTLYGFGYKSNSSAATMALFDDGSGEKLFVGTWNPDSGCEIMRMDAYDDWTLTNDGAHGYLASTGFTPNDNSRVSAAIAYNNKVYVGTRSRQGAELWRYNGGVTPWEEVVGDGPPRQLSSPVSPPNISPGFGDPYNQSIQSMAVFGGKIYAGTSNLGYFEPAATQSTRLDGLQVWTYDGTSFKRVVGQDAEGTITGPGFGFDNVSASSMAVFQNKLYVGTQFIVLDAPLSGRTAFNVYRFDGTTWTEVLTNGKTPLTIPPTINPNDRASSMAVYNNALYVGTRCRAMQDETPGCEIWRSTNGTSFTKIVGDGASESVQPGFGDPDNGEAASMAVYGDKLYVGTDNGASGSEVWSYDGASWAQVDAGGFGKIFNRRVSSMVADPGGYLFAGTFNGNGGELWRYNGSVWTRANSSGFADSNNANISSLVSLGANDLFVGTGTEPLTEDSAVGKAGCQVWRNQGAPGTISSVTPSSADQYQTLNVAIVGNNTHFTQGDMVDFGIGIKVLSTTRIDDTHMTARIRIEEYAAGGARTLKFTPADGVGKALATAPDPKVDGFTVTALPPKVRSVAPIYGPAGTKVTINGDHFGATRGSSYVKFGTRTPTSYSTWSNQKIVCKVPSGLSGRVRVRAYVAGVASNETVKKYFTVTKRAAVSGFSPSAGSVGTVVTIKGKDFGSSRGASRVEFGGVEARSYPAWSDSRIKCKVPDGAKSGPVSVITGGGTASSMNFSVTTAETPVPSSWYLAEGSSDWGFTTYITIENPTGMELTAEVTYQVKGKGEKTRADITMPPLSQTTINPANDIGVADFSTRVTCLEDQPIAVDRRMTWTGTGAASPEGHSSVGVTASAKTWYLPEGSSDWGFECWLLIQNPNDTEATCNLTYMIEDGEAKTFEKKVPANSRESFDMSKDIGAEDASIMVTSDKPVIPERAMYRNARREGHDSIGVTAPARDFYLAEGTTNYGFTTYVLVQNPNSSAASVTLTYMTENGPVAKPAFTMDANSRKTVPVNTDANLGLPGQAVDFSTRVSSDKPIIAERAMYWNSPTGEACHDSIGMAAPHKMFYLPDGETTAAGTYETYTLVQNPNDEPVEVKISYLTPEGSKLLIVYPNPVIPANSRMTFNMADKVKDGRAAVEVDSLDEGKNIMVERSMYWNSRGAGTDTIGGYSD